jgi:hypothetical protein
MAMRTSHRTRRTMDRILRRFLKIIGFGMAIYVV